MADWCQRLMEMLKEGKIKVTFDPKRDVTLCANCGSRTNGLRAWKTRVPGTRKQDCRRLCDDCAKEV